MSTENLNAQALEGDKIVRISQDTHDKIKRISEANLRSMKAQLALIVEDYLSRKVKT